MKRHCNNLEGEIYYATDLETSLAVGSMIITISKKEEQTKKTMAKFMHRISLANQ